MRPRIRVFLLCLFSIVVASLGDSQFNRNFTTSLVQEAQAAGRTYYVDSAVSASGDGSSPAQAFKTIQECANVAAAGDTCLIKGGLYREAVTLDKSGAAGSPITFKPAGEDEEVIITGLDEVVGRWDQVAFNGQPLYKIQLDRSWDRGENSNQVFVNGRLKIQARWPNLSPNQDIGKTTRDHLALSETGNVSECDPEGNCLGSYQDDALNDFGDNFWTGARIQMLPGYGWSPNAGTVTASGPGMIQFRYKPSSEVYYAAAQDPYYVWNKLEALDADNEFFFDSEGTYGPAYTLYLEGDPGAAQVEMRKRGEALTINQASHLTFERITFLAAKVDFTSDSAENVTFDRIVSQYAQQYWNFAFIFKGKGHKLLNSDLSYSGGNLLQIDADEMVIENNVFANYGYIRGGGTSLKMVTTPRLPVRLKVLRNTVFNSAGHGMEFEAAQSEFEYNRVYNIGLQSTDLAGMNAHRSGDGQGTEVAYNMVHDIKPIFDLDLNYFGGRGIRIDNGGADPSEHGFNFIIHHNLVYNTSSEGSIVVWPLAADHPQVDTAQNQVYNNTVDQKIRANDQEAALYSHSGTIIKNNIAYQRSFFGAAPPLGATIENNLFVEEEAPNNLTGEPGFVNAEAHDYRLRSDSQALDRGQIIAPFTDGYQGSAPDLGALESGQKPFVAGALLLEEHLPDLFAVCETGGTQTICRILDLPVGRNAPETFRIRIDGQTGDDCANDLALESGRVTVVCTVDTGGQSEPDQVEVSIDGVDYTELSQLDMNSFLPVIMQ